VGAEFFGTTKNGVYVPKGTQKLETTLRVHYDGGSLRFSVGNFTEVKVIWVDPSVDPNTVALGAIHKATYQVVLDGVTTKVDTKLVPAGEVPGAVDLSPWLLYTDIQSRQNDCHAAIWTDTTYTYVLEPLQLFASYIYSADGTWRYERYALEMVMCCRNRRERRRLPAWCSRDGSRTFTGRRSTAMIWAPWPSRLSSWAFTRILA
jgi:hypothetical protein